MRKTLLSVMMLSALTVATTSLTSCKDYDDDINDLQAQIDKNSKAIESIEALIKDGTAIKNVTSNSNGVTIEMANGKTYNITNGKDGETGAAGTPGTVWTIGEDGYWYCDKGDGKGSQKTSYYALGTKGDKGEKGDKGDPGTNGSSTSAEAIYYVPNAETGCFDKYQGDKLVEQTNISFRSSNAGGIGASLDNATTRTLTLTGVEGISGGTVAISLDANLRGLVYMPKLYLDGIETLVYPYLSGKTMVNHNQLTGKSRLTAQDGSKKRITGLDDYYANRLPNNPITEANEKTFNYGPVWGVQYHLNPSNSNTVYGDIKGYNVLNPEILNTEPYTRAAAADLGVTSPEKNAAGDKIFQNSNGILTAGIQIAKPQLLEEYPTKLVDNVNSNTVALQVNTKDNSGNTTTITSDYALLQPQKTVLEALYWAKKPQYMSLGANNKRLGDELGLSTADANAKVHVWDSPQEALADPDGAALELYYDDDEGIDIKSYLGIHVMQQNISDANHTMQLQAWTPAEAAKYGLTFSFNLVNYKVDGNNTVDSKYAKWVNQANGVLRAWNVKKDETPQGETSRTAIDREPLVQVLVKNNNGDVVLDGYILIHITSKPVYQKNKDVVFPETEATFDLCNTVDGLKTTWAQFSAIVLTDTLDNMTKKNFDEYYEPDLESTTPAGTDGAGNNFYLMKQFTEYKAEGEQTAATDLGSVFYYGNTEGTTNHTFRWTLTEEEAEKLTHDGKTLPVTVSRWVRYKAKSQAAPYPYLYVKLTYKLNRAEIGKDKFATKNVNYWYDAKTGADDGLSAVVLDVREPRNGGNIATFNRSISSTLVGNAAKPAGGKYYFAPIVTSVKGQDGVTYSLTTNSTNLICKYVQGNTHEFSASKLDNVLNTCAIKYDGGVFNNHELFANNTKIATLNQTTGEITLEKNATTKAVLNAVGYEANHANIAKEMSTYVGYVTSTGCGLAKQVEDGIFLTSWQRPINLKENAEQVAIDAKTNGNYIYLYDILKMFDWRGPKVGYMWGDQTWFWAYYNVKAITVDVNPAHVVTNMHLGTSEAALNTITTDAQLLTGPVNNKVKTAYKFNFDLRNFDNAAYNDQLKTWMENHKTALGYIYYENNGDNVTDFYVKVPITVEYEWGEFKTTVKITIKRTSGN